MKINIFFNKKAPLDSVLWQTFFSYFTVATSNKAVLIYREDFIQYPSMGWEFSIFII